MSFLGDLMELKERNIRLYLVVWKDKKRINLRMKGGRKIIGRKSSHP